MRVLVADDSGIMRKIIVRALQTEAITDITEAVDGVDAVAKFAAGSFDMVITDWNMPGKTGLEVLKEIRAGGSKVPVIMVTTEGEQSRVLEAIHAGVSDYLTKPFEQADLRAKIDKHAPSNA